MRNWIGGALLAASLLASGCASIVSENNSTTYIETTPPGATCVLHGQDFNRTMTTPGSINLPSEAAPVTIACSAEGYHTASEVMDTSADGWIIGNLIFGGVIGVVVDAARGAGQKYPPKFELSLEPADFETAEARDDFYAQREKLVNAKWDQLAKSAEVRHKDNRTRLDKALAEVEEGRSKELAALNERRFASLVGPPEPAESVETATQ
ncbi:MAG: hypothetical protein AB7D51_11340 [Desulfovibrionaceae bacterium]